MLVLTDSNPRVKPATLPSSPAVDEFSARVETAVQRSQNFLLSEQKGEGFWVGELMVDSTLVSDTVAYHHWNGKVDREWERKAVKHILSMQLPDGGWNIYHGGPSEVNATIKAYLALKLAGVSVKDPRMLKAREVALNFAGLRIPALPGFIKGMPRIAEYLRQYLKPHCAYSANGALNTAYAVLLRLLHST